MEFSCLNVKAKLKVKVKVTGKVVVKAKVEVKAKVRFFEDSQTLAEALCGSLSKRFSEDHLTIARYCAYFSPRICAKICVSPEEF